MHVEAARGLEEADEEGAEGDFFDGFAEDGFGDFADGGFEVGDAGIARDPAGFDVQFGDAAVVAVEEGEEVFGEVVLVFGGERAHDAEVDGAVARRFGVSGVHEDVAGVHVGVEEAVAEDLGEKDFDAALGQHFEVGAGGVDGGFVGDVGGADALHHHHVFAAVAPVHFGNVEERRVFEVGAQLAGVRRFKHEVEFVGEGVFEFAHNFHRAQAAAVAGAIRQPRQLVHQRDVGGNGLFNTGAQDFDDDVFAAL